MQFQTHILVCFWASINTLSYNFNLRLFMLEFLTMFKMFMDFNQNSFSFNLTIPRNCQQARKTETKLNIFIFKNVLSFLKKLHDIIWVR